MTFRTTLLEAVQRRVRSAMQPLYNEQAAFRTETMERIFELMQRTAMIERSLNDLSASVLHSRWINAPEYLASRNELGHWLNWLGLRGNGVEVGVLTGEYSRQLLATWEGANLLSVDPWIEFPSTEYIDTCNVSQDSQDRNFEITKARLAPFAARSTILRATSAEASERVPDASLDFVYLDAQHHYEAVRDDIQLWRRKIKAGGVMGGHDYIDGSITSGLYGVKQAVNEFVAANNYDLIITREPNWPSWIVRVE